VGIRIDTTVAPRIPHAHVAAAMEKALGRVPVRPTEARVTFTDVNGPKKGVDIECALLVSLPGQPPIRVARRAATPRAAFDLGYEVLARQLEESRDRHKDAARRPKKYFAAKRLLG
jgi:hypothetical protein